MKKLFIMTLALSFLGATAMAAQKKEAPRATETRDEDNSTPGGGISPNEGSDSCGLGWQVTNKKSFLGTTTRGTTNAVIPPTFGMTTGTIGCRQHSFAKNEVEGVKYAATNYDELKAEMAVGQGEYLQAFARTLGCSDAASAEFGKMTQTNFETLTSGTSLEFYDTVKSKVRATPALSAACGV